LQNKTKIVSCYTANSKRVKQEVNGTVILPPLVFPDQSHGCFIYFSKGEEVPRCQFHQHFMSSFCA
jgi:hypothetical protein